VKGSQHAERKATEKERVSLVHGVERKWDERDEQDEQDERDYLL